MSDGALRAGEGMEARAVDLSVRIGDVVFKKPVMVASGTFGYGKEYAEFFDLGLLGAVMVKGVSLEPWPGNPLPRIVETPSGMLNAIGLQNPGVEAFIRDYLPFLREFDVRVIVNVIGKSVDEYVAVVRRLDEAGGADAYELNISCPNIKEGGIAFGVDPRLAAEVVGAVRRATARPVIPKLSPNVTDIKAMARACEDAGADAVSAVNTFLGMAIDVDAEKPVLANGVGGLSGPAIRPLAVRMVWDVYEAVQIPIIGMGGIAGLRDALEFVLAGATAFAIGTANFVAPALSTEIARDLAGVVQKKGLGRFADLVGRAHPGRRARAEA